MKKRSLERREANRIIKHALKRMGVNYTGMDMKRAAEIIAAARGIPKEYTANKVVFAKKLTGKTELAVVPVKVKRIKIVESTKVIKFPNVAAQPSEDSITAFYASWEWKRLSYDIKLERGRKCECCGAKAPDVRIVTDHVKPLRHYWHLRLDVMNLQVLCEDCNMGKGSRDESDFRNPAENHI